MPTPDDPARKRKSRFFKWFNHLVDSERLGELKPTEVLVLICLARHAKSCSLKTFPSAKLICRESQIKNTSHVYSALKGLTEKGFLETVEKGGYHSSTSRRLIVFAPKSGAIAPNLDRPKSGARLRLNPAQPAPKSGATDRPKSGLLRANRNNVLEQRNNKPAQEKADGRAVATQISEGHFLDENKEFILRRLRRFGIDSARTLYAKDKELTGKLLYRLTLIKATEGEVTKELARHLSSLENRDSVESEEVEDMWEFVDDAESFLDGLDACEKAVRKPRSKKITNGDGEYEEVEKTLDDRFPEYGDIIQRSGFLKQEILR